MDKLIGFQVSGSTIITPTVSTRTTSVSTVCSTVPIAAPSKCNNQGLQWASYYPNPYYNNNVYYSAFLPEYFKSIGPSDTGVSTTGGGFYHQNVREYDSYYKLLGNILDLEHGYIQLTRCDSRIKFQSTSTTAKTPKRQTTLR